jgi:hypothetical protein
VVSSAQIGGGTAGGVSDKYFYAIRAMGIHIRPVDEKSRVEDRDRASCTTNMKRVGGCSTAHER